MPLFFALIHYISSLAPQNQKLHHTVNRSTFLRTARDLELNIEHILLFARPCLFYYYHHCLNLSFSNTPPLPPSSSDCVRRRVVMFNNGPDDFRFDTTAYTTTIKRRKRTNEFQGRALEELFLREPQPNNVQRREIAHKIDMTEKQIQVSFSWL